jgi:hypothetical protein
MGRPANAATRKARIEGHDVFDRIWKHAPLEARGVRNPEKVQRAARRECYAYLASQLGITEDECHFALFDLGTARLALRIMRKVPNYRFIRQFKAASKKREAPKRRGKLKWKK